jgi:hypothetical protein
VSISIRNFGYKQTNKQTSISTKFCILISTVYSKLPNSCLSRAIHNHNPLNTPLPTHSAPLHTPVVSPPPPPYLQYHTLPYDIGLQTAAHHVICSPWPCLLYWVYSGQFTVTQTVTPTNLLLTDRESAHSACVPLPY